MTVKEKQTLPSSGLHSVGQLQNVRLEKNLTLEDAFKATRISTANLRAIESLEYGKLPPDPFARGQIALYGDYLGLDGRRIAEQFFLERDGGQRTPPYLKKRLSTHCLTPKQLAEPTHISSATIASILLLCIVLSFGGFCVYTSWNPFAFLTDQTKNFSSSVINTFHPANPASGNQATQKPLHLFAVFLKDAQVLVSLDNKESAQKTYAKGTSVHWKAEKQMHLEFLQPDSADLQFNSSPLPFPTAGSNGHYILKIPAPAVP
jgi:cytoskeletal protein RodZ